MEIRHNKSGRPFLEIEGETLERANLMGEYLIHADFKEANLASANMAFANLSGADLSGANLSGANLSGANLTEADLTGTELDGVNLSGATLSLTILTNCHNLHRAQGLDCVKQPGPSSLDEQTLRASVAHLPDNFLRGAGYTRSEIVFLRKQYPAETGEPQDGP